MKNIGSKIDVSDRRFDGKIGSYEFSCYVDGTLTCDRVPNPVRDEMRLAAADAFLSSKHMLNLNEAERTYWAKIRNFDPEHKAFNNDSSK